MNQISSSIPAEIAERMFDGGGEMSPQEEAAMRERAAELMLERWHDGPAFEDMMTAIEPTDLYPHLQQMLLQIDAACYGNQSAIQRILYAVSQIQRIVKPAAEEMWRDECEALAQMGV